MAAKLETQLGQRIKDLREAASLSQADLARLVRKSVETISNFERGKTIPSVRTLAALAPHLDCDMADFFTTTTVAKAGTDETARTLAAKLKLIADDDRQLLTAIADLLARRSR